MLLLSSIHGGNTASTPTIVLEHFHIGNKTAEVLDKKWAEICTDLSIEQFFMKSLKGRGEVVGREMPQNILQVWTKTMHRCEDVLNRAQ